MPVTIDVFDFKFWNQLRNGQNFDTNLGEFTPNLVGNVGEKVKVEFKANVAQTSFTEGGEQWELIELVNDSQGRYVRSSGSFLDDAVQVGDKFTYYDNWERREIDNNPTWTATVDFISNDGTILEFTLDAPENIPTNFELENVGLVFNTILTENFNSALFLKFGLIGNDETFNFQSKVTDNPQIYYVGGLATAGGFIPAESLGTIKDWVTGSAEVDVVSGNVGFGATQYVIQHEFIINPFYTLDLRQNINSGETPELFAGDAAVKYALELELRKTLSNTGSSKITVFDLLGGFVGWYGENFNGLNSNYRIASISYEEANTSEGLEGVNINASTLATIIVDDISGNITDYSCSVYLVKLPDDENDYIGTTSDLLENFIYKSEIISSPATSTPNVNTSIVGGDLVIEYTIDYTIAEKLRLSTDDEYLLLVQIEDPTIDAGNSDRVMLIADLKNYVDVNFLAQFIRVFDYNILQHPQNLGDTGSQIPVVSNEDGLLLDALIGTDTTKDVIINSIEVQLLAYNAIEDKSFFLDSYNFAIGDLVISNGVQQISVDSLRGYPLPEGDDFNLAKITTGALEGNFRQYSIQLGQKVKWQDWIFNPRVDNVFFDAAFPNNNLNEKSSNYSNEQDYQIRLALIANVTGVDDLGRSLTGDFIFYGFAISVEDYDESEDNVSGIIQTFDLETNQSLEGNILYNGRDTLFRAVFQNATSMEYGIHRIEPSQNQGDGILELSSIKPSVANNLLKPLDGQSNLSYSLDGSEVTTECLIDGSLIQEGVSYKLSARIGKEPFVLSNPFSFVVNTSLTGSASDKFQLPFVAAGNYDVIIDKGNGDPLISINTWNDPATLLDFSSTGAGNYEVKIYGTLQGWSFNNTGDRLKFLEITNWGAFRQVGAIGAWFLGCSNMDISASDIPIIGTTNASRAFELCTSLTNVPNMNLSNVINYSSMFRNCINLASFPAMTFNTGTTSASFIGCWTGCSSLTSFPAVDLSGGNDFRNAWTNCSSLTSFPVLPNGIRGFMDSAWQNCSSLTSFPAGISLNPVRLINTWAGCTGLTSFPTFTFPNCTNFTGAWNNCRNLVTFNTTDLSAGTNFFNCWNNCQSMNNFNVDTSSGVNFNSAWQNNFALTNGTFDLREMSTGISCFGATTLNTATYDALLIATAANNSKLNVVFNGGNSTYTLGGAAEAARNTLIANGWTITDGGGV